MQRAKGVEAEAEGKRVRRRQRGREGERVEGDAEEGREGVVEGISGRAKAAPNLISREIPLACPLSGGRSTRFRIGGVADLMAWASAASHG